MKKENVMTRKYLYIIAVVFVLALTGCSIKKEDTKKIQDIEFTVVAPEDAPEELKADIEKARDTPFRLTYADQGYLYMVRGYGEKESNGYSVEVNECYETSDSIRIQTTLLGPAKGEKIKEMKTYPYVVMKTEYRDKNVIFE